MYHASPLLFFSIQYHEDQINLLLIAKGAQAHSGRFDLPIIVIPIPHSLRKVLWARLVKSKKFLEVD